MPNIVHETIIEPAHITFPVWKHVHGGYMVPQLVWDHVQGVYIFHLTVTISFSYTLCGGQVWHKLIKFCQKAPHGIL
jgi:hypothetical protein